MSEPENCRRCGLPLLTSRYLLRLEDKGETPKRLDVRLCEHCLDSLHRWLTRRQRDADRSVGGAAQDVFNADLNAEPRVAASGREGSRGHGRRERYASELDRAENFIRLKMAGIVGLIVLAAVGLTAAALFIMIKKR